MMISWNLEFGPRMEEARRAQLRAALGYVYAHRRPEDCPLFAELCPFMRAELEAHQLWEYKQEQSVEHELWEFLAQRNHAHKMGRRTAMNRYGGALHAAMENAGWWSVQLWERSCLALEASMLQGAKFAKKLVAKASDVAASSSTPPTTAPTGIQLEDKTLRSVCSNAVVVSVMTLEQREHQRVVSSIVACSKPLDAFHTEQSRLLRSVVQAEQWIVDMAAGGYARHCCDFIKLLTCCESLKAVGFVIPADPSRLSSSSAYDEDPSLRAEDDFADLFGQTVLHYLKERGLRGLWMQGWPTRAFACLRGAEEAQKVIQDLRTDFAAFDSLLKLEGKSKGEKHLESRHVLRTRANQQLLEGLKESGWVFTQRFEEMLRSRARSNFGTQIVEDINGIQRNMGNAPCRRFRKLASCLAAALQSSVIDARHKYEKIEVDTPAPSLSASLPRSAYDVVKKEASMDFNCIVTTDATAKWWSPGAERLTVPIADCEVISELAGRDLLRCVDDLWLGFISEAKHHLAIALPASSAGEVQWYFCLHHFPDSGALLWPARLVKFNSVNMSFLEPEEELVKLVVRPITDLRELQAATFKWRSWASQCKHLSLAEARSLKRGVRAFIDAPQPFGKVAATAALWDMSRSDVVRLGKYFHIPMEPGANLCDLLWRFCRAMLDADDETIMDVLYRRISQNTIREDVKSTLLEVDEAAEVLDHHDTKELDASQKVAANRRAAHNSFKDEYHTRVKQVRASIAAQPAKKKRRGEKGAQVSTGLEVRALPPHIAQADAKRFLPPLAHIWVSYSRGEWNAHLGPEFPRVYEPYARHGGSQPALKACLRRVWSQYLEKQGLSASDCPVQGLMQE